MKQKAGPFGADLGLAESRGALYGLTPPGSLHGVTSK